jgi:DNA-binding CsgD family transcriptional regulator
VHAALGSMRSFLVHGVRDERGGDESLYIALSSASFHRRSEQRFILLAHLLVPLIDAAIRKVAAYPLRRAKGQDAPDLLALSAREKEILEWLRQGKTNCDIAAALDISPFTVKNHMQRIFRKMGARNRTEAVAKYNQAFREAG